MSEYEGFTGLDLNELGTRLDHYDELREIFLDGVEIMKNMNPAYVADGDAERQKSLQSAADEITKRINVLSGFIQESNWNGDFRNDIEAVHRNVRLLLTEGVKHVNQADGSDAEGQSTQTNS